jgi:hypothetical protein
MRSDYQNPGFSYYYYSVVVSIIPVAKFVYAKNLFTPLKLSTIGIVIIAISLASSSQITYHMYIIEQIIFGFLSAVLIAPCHALVYQLFKDTQNYFEGMFWFVTSFSVLAIAPHLLTKFLEIHLLSWAGIIYIVPVGFLFIFALSRGSGPKRSFVTA